MENFIQYNSYLLIIYLSYRFLLKKQTGIKASRYFLLGGILLPLIVTLWENQVLFFTQDSSFYFSSIQPVLVEASEKQFSDNLSLYQILKVIYISGLVFFGTRFLFSLYQVMKLRVNSINKGAYRELNNSTTAFSFMGTIFIGNQIPESEKDLVLQHEQVHIQRYHSIDIIICHLLEIVFWFNPLVFQFKHFFEEIHEFEADELSCKDDNQFQYLNLLLNQNLNQFHFSLIHQFNSNHLKNRIMRIKNKPQTSFNLLGLSLSIGLFVLTFAINQQLFAQNKQEQSELVIEKKMTDSKVDKVAKFRGGQMALVEFISRTVKYPKSMKEDKVGMVFLEFKVNADGSTSDFKVLKATNKLFEKEAMAITRKMPNWIPAEKDGKKVASVLTLPIRFDPDPSASLAPPPPPPPTPPAAPKG